MLTQFLRLAEDRDILCTVLSKRNPHILFSKRIQDADNNLIAQSSLHPRLFKSDHHLGVMFQKQLQQIILLSAQYEKGEYIHPGREYLSPFIKEDFLQLLNSESVHISGRQILTEIIVFKAPFLGRILQKNT